MAKVVRVDLIIELIELVQLDKTFTLCVVYGDQQVFSQVVLLLDLLNQLIVLLLLVIALGLIISVLHFSVSRRTVTRPSGRLIKSGWCLR